MAIEGKIKLLYFSYLLSLPSAIFLLRMECVEHAQHRIFYGAGFSDILTQCTRQVFLGKLYRFIERIGTNSMVLRSAH